MAEIPEGRVIRSAALPFVWNSNHVWVTQPVEFDQAVALADRHLADLPFRHLEVTEGAGGERLAPRFRAAGWRVDPELTMVLEQEPDRGVDTDNVVEWDEQEALGLMRRWIAEDQDETPEAQRQVVEHSRLTWRLRNARQLGVAGSSGGLAAITMLFSDGPIAQVEDVYTVPEQRGRGFARALVTRAVELARAGAHELTFITADDDGWPKQLYQKLGFVPAGRVWMFTRRL